MPSIKAVEKTAKYHEIATESTDANDCAIKAIALIADIPYKEALLRCTEKGRKRGDGTSTNIIHDVLLDLGLKLMLIAPDLIPAEKYKGAHAKLNSVTTHHPDRFPAVWSHVGRYLFYSYSHVSAIIDGETHDWARGRRKQVNSIVAVYRYEQERKVLVARWGKEFVRDITSQQKP